MGHGKRATGPDLVRLGDSIRRARKGAGLTQKQLGDQLGIPDSTLSDIENGKSGLDVLVVSRIGKALGLSGSELLEGAGL